MQLTPISYDLKGLLDGQQDIEGEGAGKLGRWSSFCPSLTMSFRLCFPTLRMALLFSICLLSLFMGSENPKDLLSKGSLKERSSRNSGHSEAPQGEIWAGRHNRTQRSL